MSSCEFLAKGRCLEAVFLLYTASEAKTKKVLIVYKFINNSSYSQLVAVPLSAVASCCDLLEKKLRSVFHKNTCDDVNSVSSAR